ncbi:carbohydrate sulfotransferase 11-like [Argopecten irradians]|uniref:carbohydrate sulfotransferase 11-like n=1 Tax=Argopecten irradians TaxID=31199 RepID=UPI0037164AF9
MFKVYHYILRLMPTPNFKMLAYLVVVGATMTIYSLVWTMTSGHVHPGHAFSGIDQKVRKNRAFSSLNQIIMQSQRNSHLNAQCDVMVASGEIDMTLNVSKLDHVIVDDKYGLLYCYVPKVGCSNWKRIFLHMTGLFDKTRKRPEDIEHNEVHFKYKKRLRTLVDYSISGIHSRIRNYRKFMFVREPMERLLSAYRDKFAGVGFEDKTFQKLAKKIMQSLHPNSTSYQNVKKGDVTFLDFVKYLVQINLDGDKMFEHDEHWQIQSKLCNPCQMSYEFIGKYETMEEDANYVLKHTGLSTYSFPKRSVFYNTSKTNDTFQRYFQEIPSDYRELLRKLYHMDYILFGYKFPFDK